MSDSRGGSDNEGEDEDGKSDDASSGKYVSVCVEKGMSGQAANALNRSLPSPSIDQ